MELKQLPNGHDSIIGWCRRYPRTHPLQRNLFPNVGRLVLGEGKWFRGIDEVQEVDQCSALWFESDPKSTFHPVVVTDY